MQLEDDTVIVALSQSRKQFSPVTAFDFGACRCQARVRRNRRHALSEVNGSKAR